MKKRKLMKELERLAGEQETELVLVREGANHEIWSIGKRKLSIPRHTDINELTAKGILKSAEGQKNDLQRSSNTKR